MSLPANARLVAYLRDSGGKDQDLSLEQQEAAIRAWCKDRHYLLVDIFRDEAISGGSTVGRLGFERMLQHFRTQPCNDHGLILWKYNRFARDFDDAQFYKADLRRRGFVILSMNDSVPDGPDGRLFEAAIDWMNQRFREDLSADVKRGQHFILKQYGAFPPGTTPSGMMREKIIIGTHRDGKQHVASRLVLDPETAPLVRRAYQMRAAGAPIREIHKATKLLTTYSGYSRLFSNPIYFGRLEFGRPPLRTVIDNYIDPIVDKELWDQVQLVAQHFSNLYSHRNHPRRRGSSYLLTSVLLCGVCGRPMNGQTTQPADGKTYRYYMCQFQMHQVGKRRCSTGRVPAAVLEDAVLATLVDHLKAPATVRAIVRTINRNQKSKRKNDDKHAVDKRLRDVNRQIERLVEAISTAGHSTALLGKLSTLEEKQRELSALQKLASTPRKIPTTVTVDQVQEAMRSMEAKLRDQPDQLKTILRGFLKSVTLAGRVDRTITGTIEYYYPADEFMPMSAYADA